MENVSHNTSFDSAEEDENDLSRATNQQPFYDNEDDVTEKQDESL